MLLVIKYYNNILILLFKYIKKFSQVLSLSLLGGVGEVLHNIGYMQCLY